MCYNLTTNLKCHRNEPVFCTKKHRNFSVKLYYHKNCGKFIFQSIAYFLKAKSEPLAVIIVITDYELNLVAAKYIINFIIFS